jgi:hypothetical protein
MVRTRLITPSLSDDPYYVFVLFPRQHQLIRREPGNRFRNGLATDVVKSADFLDTPEIQRFVRKLVRPWRDRHTNTGFSGSDRARQVSTS